MLSGGFDNMWPHRLNHMRPNSTMRTAEQEAVLRSVRKQIDFWQIQAEELAGIPEPVVAEVPERTAAVHRYRHPITSETWDGEGGQPAWLREALTREG